MYQHRRHVFRVIGSVAVESQLRALSVKQRQPLSSRENGLSEDLKEMVGHLWQAVVAKMPLGYEDETGFHWGAELHHTDVAHGELAPLIADRADVSGNAQCWKALPIQFNVVVPYKISKH